LTTGINDTGGKIAAGVWGWGKLIDEKKPEAKNLVTLPL
jgi:hypothetical protein